MSEGPGARAIRTAVVADAAEVARLADQLGYPATDEAMAERLAGLLERPDHRVWVAQDAAGRAIGWLHASVRRVLESAQYVEVEGLVVDETQRGARIGERLMEQAIGWARSLGMPRVRVRSNVLRADAHRFYLRLGFRRVKDQAVLERGL